MPLTTAIGLALATLVSEDLTLVTAGLLVREGALPLTSAVAACAAGVYAGDLGLWVAGRVFGRRLLSLPWVARRSSPDALSALSDTIDARLGLAVVICRFVPGTRLPTFLAAGIWGRRPLAFVSWSLLAVLVWTPLLVVSTSRLGPSLVEPLLRGVEAGLLASLLTGVMLFGVLRLAGGLAGAAVRVYHQRLDQTTDAPT